MIRTFNFSPHGSSDPLTSGPKLVGLSQQTAFACLYDAYAGHIQDYIYFQVADQLLAEDITARVFLEAWEQLPAYEPKKSPILAWLYSITNDVVMDHCDSMKAVLPPAPANATTLSRLTHMSRQVELKSIWQQSAEAVKETVDDQQNVLILGFLSNTDKPKNISQPDPQPAPVRSLAIGGFQRMVQRMLVKERGYANVDPGLSLGLLV